MTTMMMITSKAMGGDLAGPGGTGSPPKFEMGDGPCIRPPNIWRSSVIGCVQKYELSKKNVSSRIYLSEIEVFLVKKGSYIIRCYVIYNIKGRKNLINIFDD